LGGQFGPRLEHVNRTEIGEHEHPRGRAHRLVDPAQPGVCHLTAHERDILHTRHVEVGNKHAVSVKVPGILLAQQARADPVRGFLFHAWTFP
jgi:hypothetical protein